MKILSDIKLPENQTPKTPKTVPAVRVRVPNQKLIDYNQKLQKLKAASGQSLSNPEFTQQVSQNPSIQNNGLNNQAPVKIVLNQEHDFNPKQNIQSILSGQKEFKPQSTSKQFQTSPTINSLNKIYGQVLQIKEEKAVEKKKRIRRQRMQMVASALVLFVGFGFVFSQFGGMLSQLNVTPKVAGISEKVDESKTDAPYKSWIIARTGSFQSEDSDFDQDGLSNREEFIIGSDANNPNSCGGEQTDSQKFFNLINPVNCQPINLDNQEELNKFSQILNDPSALQNFLGDPTDKSQVAVNDAKTNYGATGNSDPDSILGLFGVSSYDQLGSINAQDIVKETQQNQTKIDYLNTINKINAYMKQYRSYDALDRNWPIPVSGGKYLEVSIEYNVPLKYVLTIARIESRFGTDVHTASGALTRPGEHKNIYSMGLTDSGSNITFSSWETGVESFGKWYKRLQDKGVSDCRKWKIYNPNGDYCSKVEGIASEIDAYLKK